MMLLDESNGHQKDTLQSALGWGCQFPSGFIGSSPQSKGGFFVWDAWDGVSQHELAPAQRSTAGGVGQHLVRRYRP